MQQFVFRAHRPKCAASQEEESRHMLDWMEQVHKLDWMEQVHKMLLTRIFDRAGAIGQCTQWGLVESRSSVIAAVYPFQRRSHDACEYQHHPSPRARFRHPTRLCCPSGTTADLQAWLACHHAAYFDHSCHQHSRPIRTGTHLSCTYCC